MIKITFEESGGYLGIARACELNTQQLPDEEADALQALVTGCDLEGLTAKRLRDREDEDASGSGSMGDARDVTVYNISVEVGGKRYDLSFHEMNIPEPIGPLLDFLRRRATVRPPE